MNPAYVRGLGLWTPGYAGPGDWCRGEPDPALCAPSAALLTGPMRRRASGLCRMGAEALDQALREAQVPPAGVSSVWATAHGEHETALTILEMMNRGAGKLSPTRFHNSVHNTPSAYASIATGNRRPSTTLTGDRHLVAAAFLEAIALLESGSSDVALVLIDEPIGPPFDPRGATEPLALAFCLSSRPEGARAVLSELRRDAVGFVKPHGPFGSMYVSAALTLLERAFLGRPGTVALELEGEDEGPVWCLDLELVGRTRDGGQQRAP